MTIHEINLSQNSYEAGKLDFGRVSNACHKKLLDNATNVKVHTVAQQVFSAIKRVAYSIAQIPCAIIDPLVSIERGFMLSIVLITTIAHSARIHPLNSDLELNQNNLLIRGLNSYSCAKNYLLGTADKGIDEFLQLTLTARKFKKSLSFLSFIPVRLIKAFDANAFENNTSIGVTERYIKHAKNKEIISDLENYINKDQSVQSGGILTQNLKCFLKSIELQTEYTSIKMAARAGHLLGVITRPLDLAIGSLALGFTLLNYLPAAGYDYYNFFTKSEADYKKLETYTNEYCNSLFLKGGNLLSVVFDVGYALTSPFSTNNHKQYPYAEYFPVNGYDDLVEDDIDDRSSSSSLNSIDLNEVCLENDDFSSVIKPILTNAQPLYQNILNSADTFSTHIPDTNLSFLEGLF